MSDREMLTKKVTIVPVEVVVRNVVAGSLAKRLGLTEGAPIDPAIIEFYYKDDALGDPLVNDDHLRLLNVATPAVLREMRELGHKINAVLLPFFKQRRMLLVDFKLEFGVFHNRLILADEISPDTCRFWDQATKESMDKDRFRKDLGKIEEAYQEVLKRVCE
jgi:phosphoribosylaminoimidazole-succinocarboxamide synthase